MSPSSLPPRMTSPTPPPATISGHRSAELSESDKAYSRLMERCWRVEQWCRDLYRGGGYYAVALPQLIAIGAELDAECEADEEQERTA